MWYSDSNKGADRGENLHQIVSLSKETAAKYYMKRGVFMNKSMSWLHELEEEEVTFTKKFILSSGSLKEMASLYNVTYPTVRLRLDRLIEKIQSTEEKEQDSYIAFVRQLIEEQKVTADTGKSLICQYKKQKRALEFGAL